MSKQKAVKVTVQNIPQSRTRIWEHKYFAGGTVIFLSILLFANSLLNGYNLDDELVTRNHRLTSKGIAAIPEIFTSTYYADNMGYSYEYRPVVLVTFAIEHQVFGDNAGVSHFFNIMLYALCCLLLLKTLQQLFRNYSPILSFAITLLFIVHPSHTEVVCGIKNRDEILSLGFGLLAMYYSIRASRDNKGWAYVLIPVFYSLALMSKATIVTFSIIIPAAIVLFYSASLRKILLTSILLLLPAFVFLNFGTGYYKIRMLCGILIANCLFYVFRNPQTVWAQIVRGIAIIRPTLTDSGIGIAADKISKGFFDGILPDKRVFRPSYIFLSTALCLIYFWAIYNSFSIWAIAPMGVLVLVSLFGNKSISWAATSAIIISLAINNLFLGHAIATELLAFLYQRQVVAAFIIIAIFARRDLFFPGLIGYAIVIAIGGRDNLAELLISVIFIFLLRIRGIRIGFLILIGLLLVHDFITDARVLDWGKVTALIAIAAIHFHKAGYKIYWLILLVSLVIFHTYEYKRDISFVTFSSQVMDKGVNVVSKTSDRINPRFIPETQYRPILYVENCIDPADPISVKIGTSFEILLHYLQKTILPYPLSFYYGYSFIKPQKITETGPMISMIIYTLIFLLALALGFKDPLISFGLFVYLVSISVFSNYFINIPGMMADRFLLVPSWGWCIVLAGILYRFADTKGFADKTDWRNVPAAARYVFSTVLILYSVLTFSRNLDWKDDLTLFRHDISYVKESAQAHNLLALHLMQHSEEPTTPESKKAMAIEALGHFMEARNIYPDFFNVNFDIGRVYIGLGIPDSALVYFRNAMAIDTTYPEIYRLIGDIYTNKQMYTEAMPYYSKQIRLIPGDYYGYAQLSYDYYMVKKYDSSIAVNRAALQTTANRLGPLVNIARVYVSINKPDSARGYLDEAQKIEPGNGEVQALIRQINGNK